MKRKSAFRKASHELSFREEMGLRLEDLAPFCGVSVSMLGMIESGERHWPFKGNRHHLKLMHAVSDAVSAPMDEMQLPQPEDWEIDKLRDEAHDLEVKARRLKRQLERMVFRYRQAKTLYQVCQRLKGDFSEGTLEFSALDYWNTLAEERLWLHGPIPQKRLQMKLDELERAVEWLRGIV